MAAALAAMTCLAGGPSAHAHGPTGQHESTETHGPSTAAHPAEPEVRPAAADLATLQKDWGIELIALRQTAAGYMLDLRFRVLDATRAAPLLARHITRKVIVDRSGAVLNVPSTERLGALRTAVQIPSMVKAGRIYTALFANPGRHVKAGDKVTLVLGDFRVEGLAVERSD